MSQEQYGEEHVHDVIRGLIGKTSEPDTNNTATASGALVAEVKPAPNTGPAQTPPTHRRSTPSVSQSKPAPLPVIQSKRSTVTITLSDSTHKPETPPPRPPGAPAKHAGSVTQEVLRTQKSERMATPWVNRAEEIIKSELGGPEFTKRLERQNALFAKGCKKGGITDMFSMFMLANKVKGHFSAKTKETEKRATHEEGVAALGYAVMEPDKRVPSNSFFSQGRIHEVRARHSNSPWSGDDRRMGYRSLSLKFADHHKESPLDLILQTGYLSPFFNGDSIEEHMVAMEKRGEYVKRYLLSLPIYMQAVIDGFRKKPDSYYHQHYHSQMVFDFHAKDGKPRVGRMRCVPADGSLESGRLTNKEQKDAWFFMLLDKQEQDIAPNYLKIEFAERLRAGPVSYKLQIQLHDVGAEDDHMVYNASIPWDAAEHPWMDLAAIHLTAMLPNDVIEVTRFNVGRLPECTLSFPEPTSVFDFNIVPALREETYEYCQKLRPLEASEETTRGRDTEYLIHIVTGDHPQAANMDAKCNLHVTIVGSLGRTSYLKLTRKTKNDFAVAAQSTFCVTDKNVGEFVCLKLFKDKKGTKTDWLCESVIFTTPYNNRCYKLPCQRWLTDDTPAITLRTGTASLDMQEKNSYLLLMRNLEVASKRGLYDWMDRDKDSEEECKGFPGSLDTGSDALNMPHDFRLQKQKALDMEWSKHIAAASSFMRTIKNMFKSRAGSVEEEYGELVTSQHGKEVPEGLEHVMRHWRDDQEFVRQLLNMSAPLKIAELQELPSNLPITDAMLDGLLEPGRTLQEEIDDGKIFLMTFPELEEFAQYDVTEEEEAEMERVSARLADDNVSIAESVQSLDETGISLDIHDNDSMNESDANSEKSDKEKKKKKSKSSKKPKAKPPKILRKYLCAPQLLLYNKTLALIPLAIQLSQQPTNFRSGPAPNVIRPAPVIYTMKDSGGDYSDWLVAKMWVKTAAAHTQHLSMHVLGCHLLMEPIALSIFRNLPSAHPLFKLLAPHLRNVMAINAIYRKHVLPHDKALSEFLGIGQDKGHMHEFIRQQYSTFKLSLLNLPDSYAERGVLEEDSVPGYLYRDDSLKLWEALHQFTQDILALYYPDDAAVTKDDELVAMLTDLRRNGFHKRSDIPERFSKVSMLTRFTANVLYRCTVHHSVSSNTMLDLYSFAPNAPPCMMRPPPRVKRGMAGWDEDVVRFMLPPPDLVERYVETLRLMNSDYSPNMTLGEWTAQLFTDERPLAAVRKLQRRLTQIDSEIAERNSRLDVAYEYFMSKNILSSICF